METVALTKTYRTLRVLVLGGAGFALSGLFSGTLGLARNTVVLVYVVAGSVGTIAFYRLAPGSFHQLLRRHWIPGAVVGLGLGALLSISVMKQPSSSAPSGFHVATALVWLGLVYGIFDGLLLTVAPVLAVFGIDTPGLPVRTGTWRRGVMAFAASLFVTAAYHLGYVEFRGPQLLQPLIGNAVVTAGYLATGNIATPLIAHVIMHGAAVLHGMETTAQLPPHYPRRP